MGLREDAIKACQDDRRIREEKQAAQKSADIARRCERAQKDIREFFRVEVAPLFTLISKPGSYWPDAFFELGGMRFEYILNDDRMRVNVVCPKCHQDDWIPFYSGANGDYTSLGQALLWANDPDRHVCPTPLTDPPPVKDGAGAPKKVELWPDSPEARLLEAVRDMIYAMREEV